MSELSKIKEAENEAFKLIKEVRRFDFAKRYDRDRTMDVAQGASETKWDDFREAYSSTGALRNLEALVTFWKLMQPWKVGNFPMSVVLQFRGWAESDLKLLEDMAHPPARPDLVEELGKRLEERFRSGISFVLYSREEPEEVELRGSTPDHAGNWV